MRDYPRIVVPPPGPKARAIVERQDRWASTSYPKEYPLAVARGEFPRGADPIVALQTLIAPLYFRLLVTAEPLDDWPIVESATRLLRSYAKPSRKKPVR